MEKTKVLRVFDTLFTFLFFILVVGTPLIFTSYTRSVFEVNKLLLLRVVTLFTMGLWLFRYLLFKDNGLDTASKEDSIGIWGFYWKKIGLERVALIWLGINAISTLFSQNFYVSIIGSYDRWEGIITVINYIMLFYMFAKCVKRPFQIQWILGGLLGAAALSSVYGVLQSLHFDFMNWSQDPTLRVFACINNPVHYCAYVAMVVPFGIGWLLYLSTKEQSWKEKPKWMEPLKWSVWAGSLIITLFSIGMLFKAEKLTLSFGNVLGLFAFIPLFYLMAKDLKWSLFFLTVLIYYTQFLSFSRATWLGFVGAMPLFYMIVTNSLNMRSKRHYQIDFLVSAVGIAAFILVDVFKFYQKSLLIAVPLFFVLSAYLIYLFWIFKEDNSKPFFKEACIYFFGIVIVTLNYGVDWSGVGTGLSLTLHTCLTIAFISVAFLSKGTLKQCLARIVLILIFSKLQFVAVSLKSIFLYGSLLVGYYFLALKGNPSLLREKKFWLLGFLAVFAGVIVIPSLPTHLTKLFNVKSDSHLVALQNVTSKLSSYRRDALEGTARTSMWQSSVPWIRDYWLLGSGPDTIKFMYPKYRRPEYGILEGGHNFTPDRLHNEYLNTLATRGIAGFLIYYIGIIGGWFFLMVSGMYQFSGNPYRYIAAGFMTGIMIYLGQVLFNFGVVATLVLFYVLMGLGLALIRHSAFKEG